MRKLIYILLFVGGSVFGQTRYYVDNTGTGDTLATISEVNALSLSAGDTVSFKRGCLWNVIDDTPLVIGANEDGTSGSPIVLNTYGSGLKPIITARDTIDGADQTVNWADQGSNVWRFNFGSSETQRFWVDGTEMTKAANTSVDATDRFRYSNPYIYFYSVGNPASNYSLFEHTGASEVNYHVYIQGDYIYLISLDLRGSYLGLIVQDCRGVVIDSCNIGDSADEIGIYWDGGDLGEIKNCILDTKCTIDISDWDNPTYTEDGINIRGRTDTLLIHDNYFKNWQHGAVHPFTNSTSDTLRHVWIYDNEFTAPDITYGYGINVNTNPEASPDMRIFRNYIHDIPLFNAFSCDGVMIYNNIISNIFGNDYFTDSFRSSGLYFYQNSGGAVAINNKVYNNTIVDCEDGGIVINNSTGTTVKSGNEIANNLIYNCGIQNDPDLTGFNFALKLELSGQEYWGITTYRNNGFYSPNNVTGDSLIYYGKIGGEFHSDNWTGISGFNSQNLVDNNGYPDTIQNNFMLDTSPFVDYEGGDYRLAESVNAINAGIDVGLTTDFLGNEIVGLPDVGAYEYDGEAPVSPSTTRYSFSTPLRLNGKTLIIRQ
jgi:hypothetical protein